LHGALSSGKTVRTSVSSEIVTNIPERAALGAAPATRRDARALAVLLIGPLVMVGGLVWAVAQPYRLTFLYRDGKGFYDWLVQPPLLVLLVGALFSLAIARGLVDDLEAEEHGPAA
jgi:hypothetical protein